MNSKTRIPLKQQVPFAHLQQKEEQKPAGPPDFVVPVKATASKQFLSNKAFVMNLKKAWQTGSLQLINFELTEIPNEVIQIESINIEGEQWWQKCPLTKLDLSNNKIEEIPLFETLQELTVLRLNNNLIKRMQPELGAQFFNLKSLSLVNNKLTAFQCELKSLVELNLADNQLVSFGALRFPNLELLDITNNTFQELPKQLPAGLKKLTAINNRIKVVEATTFAECRKLEEIHLSKNHIQEVHPLGFNIPKLKLIDLKENRLKAFTQQMLGLDHKELDSLQLSFNNMELFDCYQGCENLTVLLLNNNKLSELRADIINFKQLKNLDIANNDLSDLPCQLGFLPQLIKLSLEGNPLKCIRSTIRSAGTLQIKKYLQSRAEDAQQVEVQADPKLKSQMYTANNMWEELFRSCLHKDEFKATRQKISQIDQQLFRMRNLINLDLSSNQIEVVSKEIMNLENLKQLNLSDNKLMSLPSGIFMLSNLTVLELRQNKLTQLTNDRDVNLPNLVHLDVSKNLLAEIPWFVACLDSLLRLLLGYNQIASAQMLTQSPMPLKIEVLDISNNQISNLEDGIYYCLPYLQSLNISNNNLKIIPTILGFMNLKAIQVEGNPTKLITSTIINKGTVHILDYLKNKHPLDQIPQRFELKQQSSQQQQKQQMAPQPASQQQTKMLIEPQRPDFPPYQDRMIVEEERQEQKMIDKAVIQSDIQQLDKEMKMIEKELAENYALNKFQIQDRKKRLQQIMIQRSQLYQMLG